MLLDVNEVSALPFFAGTPGWPPRSATCAASRRRPRARCAYAVDGSGYEAYNVRVRAASGVARRQIVGTAGSVAWAGDATLF